MSSRNRCKLISLQEALKHAASHEFVKTLNEKDRTIALFSDKSEIAWVSEFENDLSDVTPGEGIQAPSIWLKEQA